LTSKICSIDTMTGKIQIYTEIRRNDGHVLIQVICPKKSEPNYRIAWIASRVLWLMALELQKEWNGGE